MDTRAQREESAKHSLTYAACTRVVEGANNIGRGTKNESVFGDVAFVQQQHFVD